MINIFLAGSMKNVNYQVGRALAQQLGMQFSGIDEFIEERTGIKIGQLLDDFSIEYIAKLEKSIYKEINAEGLVFATDASVFLDEENINKIIQKGYFILLTADLAIQKDRIKADNEYVIKNNLLENLSTIDDIINIKFKNTAHYVLDTSNLNIEECVSKIREGLKL